MKGFRYYRWRVNATPSSSGGFFCANELEMRNAAGSPLLPTRSVASSQSSNGTGPSKLFDGDRQSGHFCTEQHGQQGLTGWVWFDMGKPVWVQQYTFWSRQNLFAMPSAWVFEGSSASTGPWNELDVQDNLPKSSREQYVGTYMLQQKTTTTTSTIAGNVAASATVTLTSSTVTSISSTLTTFTWTASAAAITGSFVLQVRDPEAFMSDPYAKVAAREAVAAVAGVPQFLVAVSLRLQNSRRLPGRVAQAAGVLVDFEIAVPSIEVAENTRSTMSSMDLVEVISVFQNAAVKAGLPSEAQPIDVQVMEEPSLPLDPSTTKLSASNPETSSNTMSIVLIIALAGGAVVLLVFVGTLVACYVTRRKPTEDDDNNPNAVDLEAPGNWLEEGREGEESSLSVLRSKTDLIRGWGLQVVADGSDTLDMLSSLLDVPHPSKGIRKDARERSKYTKLSLRGAWRIQAPTQESKYKIEVDEVKTQIRMLEHHGMSAPSVTTVFDSQAERLGVDASVNEKILLHGTKPELLLSILQSGLNERTSVGLFGLGLYLAEDASKTDQYCTEDFSDDVALRELHDVLYAKTEVEHPGRASRSAIFYQLVCRVSLGYPIITKDGESSIHDPEMSIYATHHKRECAGIPCSSPPIPHHSLIAEKGPLSEGYVAVQHREFVQFHSQRVLPEYLIAYSRDERESMDERDSDDHPVISTRTI